MGHGLSASRRTNETRLPNVWATRRPEYSSVLPSKKVELILAMVLYVWFDKNIDDNCSIQTEINFLRENGKQVLQMSDFQTCEQWLVNRKDNEKIVLILPSECAKALVPNVHYLPSIISIYVLNKEFHVDTKWTEKYSKVRGIFVDPKKLAQQLSLDSEESKRGKDSNFQLTAPKTPVSTGPVGIKAILEKSKESRGVTLNSIQFVLIDLSSHLDELASAMLECLRSLAGGCIIMWDNFSPSDFSNLPRKTTLLFISSILAATMKEKPEQIKATFILENDKRKIDNRVYFENSVDLIFQLADEIYCAYKNEAKECSTPKDAWMQEAKEKQADRIYKELTDVYERFSTDNNTKVSPLYTTITTTLVWLTSNTQGDNILEKLRKQFGTTVSSILIYDNRVSCQRELQQNKADQYIFLIISADYGESIVADFQQMSNVKMVYLYGQSSSSSENIIANYDHLRRRIAHDLIGYYHQLATEYSVRKDTKTAKDLYMKAYTLCNILSEE